MKFKKNKSEVDEGMYLEGHNMQVEIRENMRGGMGSVRIKNIWKEGLPEKCRLFAHLTLEKGCSIGYHEHVKETEIFYFIRGEGRVNDNGAIRTVKAGDTIHTGGGNGHSVENIGEEPLEFIAVIVLD